MAKQTMRTFTIDKETQALLAEIAKEYDGNESMTVRQLIRKAARSDTVLIPIIGTMTGKGDEIGKVMKVSSHE